MIRVDGWVVEIRDLGGIKFIKLFTPERDYQITLPKGKVPDHVFRLVDEISRQSAISVYGELVKNPEAPSGEEIIPSEIKVWGLADKPLPLDPRGVPPAELDTRLDWRFLDLRNRSVLAVFKIQHEIVRSFREFFEERGFYEIFPPCIIASASEGGAELFRIPYFEREAYLAQSPQLYKQMCAISLGKVFMIVPVFRAEKFNTPTHLNEIRQMDVEIAFVDSEEDAMKVLEKCLVHILAKINERCREELEILGRKVNVPKLPLRRVTYHEAVELLRSKGFEIEFGDDFTKTQEYELSEAFGEAFFIKDWPSSLKPFYAMPLNESGLCRAFDLIHVGLEVSSGTQRIHIPELLEKNIRERGLNPKNFEYYISCFRYGAPPHAGFSIGLERLTMTITGKKNIRECCMFPRDRSRLTP